MTTPVSGLTYGDLWPSLLGAIVVQPSIPAHDCCGLHLLAGTLAVSRNL
jgi:hypothetical protein